MAASETTGGGLIDSLGRARSILATRERLRNPCALDQANIICFLAASEWDYVTGLTIDVTGDV